MSFFQQIGQNISNFVTQVKENVKEELREAKVTITVKDDSALKSVQQTLDKLGTKYTTVDKTVIIQFE